MYSKVAFSILMSLCLVGQSVATQEMTNKEIAIKAAKIAGYSAELVAALASYALVHMIRHNMYNRNYIKVGDDYYPTLIDLEDCTDPMGAIATIAVQTPFFVTIIHAVCGLKKELTPIANALFNNAEESHAIKK